MSGAICIRIDRDAVRERVVDRNFPEDLAKNGQEAALIDAVRQALDCVGHSPMRDLEIEVSIGVVVLWGRVPTYYQKQLAQATVQSSRASVASPMGWKWSAGDEPVFVRRQHWWCSFVKE